MTHLLAMNVARSLFLGRSRIQVSFLSYPGNAELITADQPLINMRGNDVREGLPTEFELYFPLSPEKPCSWRPIIRIRRAALYVTSPEVRWKVTTPP
jgi:hypothetical protein